MVITDQLDSNLDWSTFSLTEVGFGDHVIAVPPKSQHFETTVPATYNGVSFNVQIDTGIDLATGEVYAKCYLIDPNTSLPPPVPIGLLPPEDGTGRGKGYFSYAVSPKAGLPTGTEIRNIALVSFDGQPQVATNQVDPHDPSSGTDPAKECLVTIDSGVPTSSVAALPAAGSSTQFTVSWAGADDPGGSGVASYDIYVSDNGCPYALWKSTSDPSATFAGQPLHSYAFYSVAYDNAGNVEDPPATPDAQTFVAAIDGTSGDDTIRLRLDPANSSLLQVFTQDPPAGAPAYGITLAALPSLTIHGLTGNDTLIVDMSYGNPVPAGGLSVDGGDGGDELVVSDAPAGSDVNVSPTQVLFGTSAITLNGVEDVKLGGSGDVVLGSLDVASGATLKIAAGGRTLHVSTLSLDPAAKMDLADNTLIVDDVGAYGDLRDRIASAQLRRALGWPRPGLLRRAR